mgnify:CR=1 FL=1
MFNREKPYQAHRSRSSILFFNHKLYIVGSIIFCLIIVAIEYTDAPAENQKSAREYTKAQLRAKHARLVTAMERVDQLKKQGDMPRAIEEAKEAVSVAKEEFGAADLTAVNPLLTLVELLGGQRRYGEAEASIKELYAIIQAGGKTSSAYAIAYRLRIAKLYVQWKMLEKAESTLIAARDITAVSDPSNGKYTKIINAELLKIDVLKEANRFRIKDE